MATGISRTTRNSRERILTAAEDVVLSSGVARLTLQAAADRAGVSKGGVLYHFPSRDALVSAMVARLVDGFESELALAEAQLAAEDVSEPAGRFTRAYIRCTVAPPVTDDERRQERVGAAVMAAMAAEPDLMAPLRAACRHWQARIEQDGLDPVTATAARLAADGLWLTELLGLAELSPAVRAALADRLEALVR